MVLLLVVKRREYTISGAKLEWKEEDRSTEVDVVCAGLGTVLVEVIG